MWLQVDEGQHALRVPLPECFPPLAKAWLFPLFVALGCLLLRMVIDEKGWESHLYAEDAGAGRIRLTLDQANKWVKVVLRRVWEEEKMAFVARWCALFEDRLGEGFADDAWHYGEWRKHLPTCERYLPWRWPVGIVHRPAAHWTRPQRMAWGYLQLAVIADPFWLRRAWCPPSDFLVGLPRHAVGLSLPRCPGGSLAQRHRWRHPPNEAIYALRDAIEDDLIAESQKAGDWRGRLEHDVLRLAWHKTERMHGRLVSCGYLRWRVGHALADESSRLGRIEAILQGDFVTAWGELGYTHERRSRGPHRMPTTRWPMTRSMPGWLRAGRGRFAAGYQV